MKVPLLDLKPQLATVHEELSAAVQEVIDSTRYIGGPKVEELEREIASYCGVEHGIGVSSGTDALLVALMGLDVGIGDSVITTPYSFFATAGVISRLGARPIFVDIDPDSYNLSPTELGAWLENNPKDRASVKAILPVHLFGQMADMDALLKIGSQFQIPIVEDAAQAIGSIYPSKEGEKKAGSLGICGCFSFFPSKNLGAIGDAGMVVTNDEAFANRLRQLRSHGAKKKYFHPEVGGNFRLDPIQAAALLVKLPHLEGWHRRRQENAGFYDQNLTVPGIKTPGIAYKREFHIYNQYVISVEDRRDELQTHLSDHEIGTAIYYPRSFHEQECFQHLGYAPGDFPCSEYAAAHTLALPIYPGLTHEMQQYVVDTIRTFFE